MPSRTPQHAVVRGTHSYLSAWYIILHAQLQPHCWSLQLALAAATAATRVLTNKGFCNTQHLQRGKTTLIVTGSIPLCKGWYLFNGGGISLCSLLLALSWSFYSQGPQRELTHFQMCALVQLDQLVEGSWGCWQHSPHQVLRSTNHVMETSFELQRASANDENVRCASILSSVSAPTGLPQQPCSWSSEGTLVSSKPLQ